MIEKILLLLIHIDTKITQLGGFQRANAGICVNEATRLVLINMAPASSWPGSLH